MVNYERKFKIKVKSGWTAFKNSLTSTVIVFKEFCMEKRLSNIFRTTKVTKLIKAILKSSYRNGKTLKQSVYFLRTVKFCSFFDIQISITLAIFWEKL